MIKNSFIFNEKIIKEKLIPCDSNSRISLEDDSFTKSAILFTIIPYEKKPYDLVLIHRTNRGSKHRGEISFPGGKFEPSKDASLMDTALRETCEEIGVDKKNVKIIGCLDDFPTLTRYIITPFVGLISKNQKLKKDKKEVQKILKISIEFFLDKKNFKEQAIEIDGEPFPIFYYNYIESNTKKLYTIWGATAYLISSFIERVHGITHSKLGLKRFQLDKIKFLKEYIKYKNQITKNFDK
ncbi:MAG: NUDIX hydrolase [Promethearchaeota archaeon]